MRFNLDNYETVEARLAKFWEENPNGQIFTQIFHYDENRVVFKAECYKDINDPRPVATGYAEEVRDASPVNRTSFVENAETSAIGRCLSNWKYQSKAAPRPSRQEMEKVERMNQSKPAELLTKFREACAKAALDPEAVAMEAGVDLNALTEAVMPKLRDAFKKINDGMNQLLKEPKPEVQEIIDKVTAAFPGAVATGDQPQIKDPTAKASSAQLGMIRAKLNATGLSTRADQHDYISEIINRPITALDMLNKGEADSVIKALDARGSR
jgi:hypothetical protein